MKAAVLPYSGEYEWVETAMYWSVKHEVMPSNMALSCQNCHQSLTSDKTCNRCHEDNRHLKYKELISKGIDFKWLKEQGRDVEHLIGETNYIDFKELGYEGDPISYGGRFKKLPLKMQKKP